MNIAVIFDYTVRTFSLRNMRASTAAAAALGSLVNAEAAETRQLAKGQERFAQIKEQCLETWAKYAITLEPNLEALGDEFDVSIWITIAMRVADGIFKDVIKMEHNLSNRIHLIGGEIMVKCAAAEQLVLESDRLVKENAALVIEAAHRGWVVPNLTKSFVYMDTEYSCEKRLEGFRIARALEAAQQKLKKVG